MCAHFLVKGCSVADHRAGAKDGVSYEPLSYPLLSSRGATPNRVLVHSDQPKFCRVHQNSIAEGQDRARRARLEGSTSIDQSP